jgi:thiol-disulfide isomerase/thioredoxin
MADLQPYWILVAGLILLYVFALLFVSWRPSVRRLGPGGTQQQHLLGPGGTRHLFGYEGFASNHANGMNGGLAYGGVYTTEGFESRKPTFFMFGVDWCPHCVSAKPEFEKLKETIGDRVNVVYVNPEKQKSEAAGFQIDGYPTFHLVKDGQKQKYSGGRKHGDFLSWLQNETA